MRGQKTNRGLQFADDSKEGEMRLGYLVVAGLILLSASPALTIANRSVAVSFASSYRQDAKGLEAEYQPFLNAFNEGQAPPFDKEFAALTLPDPAGWFGQYFETEHVQALVDDYEAEIAAEQKSLFTIMTKFWPSGTHFKVHCKLHPPSPARFQPRQDAYEPKKAIPVEQFDVEFEADRPGTKNGRSMSILVNTVWTDGAYRYVGKGAYPFWSMPDASAH
jgi:hypothetical protein